MKGEIVKVMIRPERLHPQPRDDPHVPQNVIPARIAEKIFLGEATKYHARVSPDHVFVCRTLTTTDASACNPGDDGRRQLADLCR
jgi:hypothetical protein